MRFHPDKDTSLIIRSTSFVSHLTPTQFFVFILFTSSCLAFSTISLGLYVFYTEPFAWSSLLPLRVINLPWGSGIQRNSPSQFTFSSVKALGRLRLIVQWSMWAVHLEEVFREIWLFWGFLRKHESRGERGKWKEEKWDYFLIWVWDRAEDLETYCSRLHAAHTLLHVSLRMGLFLFSTLCKKAMLFFSWVCCSS